MPLAGNADAKANANPNANAKGCAVTWTLENSNHRILESSKIRTLVDL